jgi:carbonic anhydrase/acetyltransferase-like protein (isoleucine patch superfamily)
LTKNIKKDKKEFLMEKIIRRLKKGLTLGKNVFIAESANVIGDCIIEDDSSIWYNVTIRADVEKVIIGKYSNIQDGTVIHVTKDKFPTILGNYVTVGHNATLHGCNIKNNVLIGIGAIILDDSLIEENTIVAAGALVTPGKKFPPNSLIMGSPAKVVKTLSQEEIDNIRDYAERYIMYKNVYLNMQ